MPTTIVVVECHSCTAEFEPDELGGAVFECGDCGGFVSDEGNRCPTCNKFAAKLADASCPECEADIDPDDLDEVERFVATDGSWHATAADVAEWDADAPARAAAVAAHQVERERQRAERQAQRDALHARLVAAVAACPTPLSYYDGEHPDSFVYDSTTAQLTPVEWCELLRVSYIADDRDRVTACDYPAMRARLREAGVDWRHSLDDQVDDATFGVWASGMLDATRFGVTITTELLPLIEQRTRA